MGEILWGKSTPALHINENCIFFSFMTVKYLVIRQHVFKLSNND